MTTLYSDTNPEIERIHIELIRKASISRRLQIVASLVKTTYQLSWQGICERYPNRDMEARLKRFIQLLYGDEMLAKKVVELVAHRYSNKGLKKDE